MHATECHAFSCRRFRYFGFSKDSWARRGLSCECHPRFVFDSFEVDLEAHELRKEGTRVRLRPQPFEILVALLERAGAVVTLEDLRSRLWGSGVHLDAVQSIHRSVNRLRAALCDSAVNPRYIETVNRTGYRFIARVERSAFEHGPQIGHLSVIPEKRSAGGNAGVWIWHCTRGRGSPYHSLGRVAATAAPGKVSSPPSVPMSSLFPP
jgi:DNA-binding winged helix-turn-helix (wHTH) protein